MKRRNFLKASFLTGAVAGLAPQLSLAANARQQKKTRQEFYELREYNFTDARQQAQVEDYFEKAAIPALNRMGSKHIGVFREQLEEGQPRLFVLIPFSSLEAFGSMRSTLDKDKAYQQAAAPYLQATAAAPAYARIRSSLMKAFAYLPQLEVPEQKARVFELRRYESPSELAGRQKIKMFNEGGELEIFRRTGLDPVFFGETLVGEQLPNLTYMIAFDDMEEHARNWKKFVEDPEWIRIKDLPEYVDTVSNITNTFLVPAPFSQI